MEVKEISDNKKTCPRKIKLRIKQNILVKEIKKKIKEINPIWKMIKIKK